MADLTNSKRVSYKATYNQVSPSATATSSASSGSSQGTGKRGSRSGAPYRPASARPFEKAALIRALDLVPAEVQALRGARLPRAATGVTREKFDAQLLMPSQRSWQISRQPRRLTMPSCSGRLSLRRCELSHSN